MKNNLSLVLSLLGLFGAFLISSSAFAQEASPGDSCSTAQQFMTVGGPEKSGNVHFMVCQGGTWKSMLSANANGEVTKFGNLNCSTNDYLQWNGSRFACVTGIGGCDSVPTTYEFTDVANALTSTLTTSNAIFIVGVDSTAGCESAVSVSGDGSPQYRVCSDAGCSSIVQNWTASNQSINMFDRYLQVRTTSASTSDTAHDVTVSVGGVTNVWTVTTGITGACGASPTIGQVCSDGTVYAGISPDGNRAMYVARCDVGMSWSGSACTGTRSLLSWNDGNSNWTPTGTGDRNQGENNTAALITTDSNSVAGGVQEHEAAQACADYDDGNGNTDWYLPAINELNVIYENLVDGSPNDNNPDPVISGFNITGSVYWSSTEFSTNGARRQRFSDGDQSSGNKNSTNLVRCVRR